MELAEIQVTAAKAKQFATRGIYCVDDLLSFLPTKYKDFTQLSGWNPGVGVSCFRASVESVHIGDSQNGRPFVFAACKELATLTDVRVYWFGQGWMYQQIRSYIGKKVVVAGKVDFSPGYGYTIRQPDLFGNESLMGVYPVYKSIQGMSADYLTTKIQAALNVAGLTSEILPQDIVDQIGAITMPTALRYVHRPQSMDEARQGAARILLNDLTYFALHNELNRRESVNASGYVVTDTNLMLAIEQSLPFLLTADQGKTLDDMVRRASLGERINALVQGDVGCGKTIVCALLAAAFIGSGYQVVCMAPTQVLAKQHLETMRRLFEPNGIQIAYLDSSLSAKDKKAALAAIRDGAAQLIVGTHSCIAKAVEYKNLALTIVDEEHKFGVAQRAAIVEKAASGVHNITMSATPIPRSLATIIYGESVQLHTIHSMPAGRKPILTGINQNRRKLYSFLVREARAGHQAYVVCPLIDKSDSERMAAVRSVEEVSQEYIDVLSPYNMRIATLTGRDSKEHTESVLADFYAGNIDVLIATTVIEIGVNVPNATVMVIESAERFGLSALHQLRGRVGRGNDQAYCVLCSQVADPEQIERLQVLCNSTDGFHIAEEDLRLRGAGNLLGTQQSGESKYIQLLLAFPQQYQTAISVARELANRGPECCALSKKVTAERTKTDG